MHELKRKSNTQWSEHNQQDTLTIKFYIKKKKKSGGGGGGGGGGAEVPGQK